MHKHCERGSLILSFSLFLVLDLRLRAEEARCLEQSEGDTIYHCYARSWGVGVLGC